MFILHTIASAASTVARSVKHWIYQLGGVGFIPLGILDNSIIPLPGSMDVLTIFLSARKEQLWLYYALMATVGSVAGGFVTYRLARKGGKETLARRFPPKTLDKVYIAGEALCISASSRSRSVCAGSRQKHSISREKRPQSCRRECRDRCRLDRLMIYAGGGFSIHKQSRRESDERFSPRQW